MTRIGWDKKVNDFRQEVADIRRRAGLSSGNFYYLKRQADYCKLLFLAYQLEVKRRSLVYNRGVNSVLNNGKKLQAALGFTLAASIVTRIISKDSNTATTAGVSVFDGALRGIGEVDWAVCLDRPLTIMPLNNITTGRVWFTWDSVITAINELARMPQTMAHIRTLDEILLAIRNSQKLVAIPIIYLITTQGDRPSLNQKS